MNRDIFSSKLKLLSLILILVGALGIMYGFITSHNTPHVDNNQVGHYNKDSVELLDSHDHHALANRPWSALYTALLFFFLLTLGVLVFYALQYASQAGWSIVLLRVMEGITSYLLPGSILLLIFLILSGSHVNHIFVWMDAETVASDALLQGKTSFLNVPSFLIRAIFYLLGWNLYRYVTKYFSFKMDELRGERDTSLFKRNFKISAGFLAFFIVTESAMSWDWIMSLEPHWFSTLYAWYVFSSFFVAGIAMLTVLTLHLKSVGALPKVNENHLHDLGRFMFAISIFWSYLWFCQFLLIWYANIPEETTYFASRIADYKVPFFGMVVFNLVLPVLLLIDRDAKRNPKVLLIAAIIILIGHYTDFFMMIMPGLVGNHWFFGIPEFASVCLFLGLFLLIVLTALSKFSLESTEHPLFEESKRYH